MKVSLDYTNRYVKDADEIKVNYMSGSAIFNVIEKYPNVPILVEIPLDVEIDWKLLGEANILSRYNLIVGLNKENDIQFAKEQGIAFMMNYFCTSHYEFNALVAAGARYIRVAAPLFFSLGSLKNHKNKVRIAPTITHVGIKRDNVAVGQWIRPEDLQAYENLVEICEFLDMDKDREQAMYKIYFKDKAWPGELNMIWQGFEAPGYYNRLIGSEVTEARLSCGQKCQEDGRCKICERAINLSKYELIKEYVQEKE